MAERAFLGSWTTPTGNSVAVYLEGDADAYSATLFWDSPPPFDDPRDLDDYRGRILPAIIGRVQELTERVGPALVVRA